MERCVVVGVDDDDGDVGARVAGLDTNKRAPCAKAYVGHRGYRLHVEGSEFAADSAAYVRQPVNPIEQNISWMWLLRARLLVNDLVQAPRDPTIRSDTKPPCWKHRRCPPR
jgi:hypothetical protein